MMAPQKTISSPIFLFDEDQGQRVEIAKSLELDGLEVRCFKDLQGLADHINYELPTAILLGISIESGVSQDVIACIERVRHLQPDVAVPVIVLSSDTSLETRLAVIRAGADFFIVKPVNNTKLINVIHDYALTATGDPYRVLLVDDDESLLEFNALILQNAGMVVKKLCQPMLCLEVLDDFKPDILLLDVYMPYCSGLELARIIRQEDLWEHMPIIFLSRESDLNMQMQAMSLGGDDFIVKPIDGSILVEIVSARIKRARDLTRLNKSLKVALRESEFRQIAMDQHAIVSIADISGAIIYINDKFCEISGYESHELLGQNHRVIKSGEHAAEFYTSMWKTISQGKVWQGEICNKNKKGELYWVESTIVPFLNEKGRPYQYVSVRTDITSIIHEEQQARAAEQRMGLQKFALAAIATDPTRSDDYHQFMKKLTRKAVEALVVSRVSIWFFNSTNTAITCHMLYELKTGTWSEGMELKLSDYPDYFKAIDANVLIIANNAHNHPATHEFSEGYLKPLGIGAMLDAPIRRQGYPEGVICIEHVGGRREWALDEQQFATSLAGILAMQLESIELRRTKEEAENASRAKSQFLSSMSHELRTPMNAIIGFSQLMKMDDASPLDKNQMENVDEIYKAGIHLLMLINEVLDLAKIEAGRINLSIERVVVKDVLHECLSLIAPLVDKRGIGIQVMREGSIVDLKEVELTVRSDHTRLKQVVLNLLTNAVKYNKENGCITIDLAVKDTGKTRVSIIDTGQGISTEDQAQLFQAFNRLGADNSNIEGTGIGLVITKNIVELMGGDIGISSEPDKGSTFWIELPHDDQHHAVTVVKKSDAGTLTQENDGHEYSVLYIEDNPANLRLVAQLLTHRPHIHLRSAHEPVLGLELAFNRKPDLILLDINLPGMSGYEVIKQLRQREETRDTIIIAISANAMPGDIRKGLDAGFDHYITKPIDVAAFMKKIDSILMKSGR